MSEAPRDTAGSGLIDALVSADQLNAWLASTADWTATYLLTLDVGLQLLLVLAAGIPALLFGPRLRRRIAAPLQDRPLPELVKRAGGAVAIMSTPLLLYLALLLFRVGLGSFGHPTQWVAAAIALMNAWIVVRLVTLVIRSRFWSQAAFYIAWPIAALDAFGLLGPVVEQLRALAIPLGTDPSGQPIEFSLLDVLRTVIYFAVLFWGARLVSSILQRQVEHSPDISPSLRALLVKLLDIVLPLVAMLIALHLVGFNLATLAVFSGAVGLGIGLGMQRSVANFVAGFTLIADKSIKPGDVIEIDQTFGWVTSMHARYVALRTRDGTEHLIPNERFMTEGVVNWTRSDTRVRLHAPFGVAYSTRDLRGLQALAVAAALQVPRVLAEPAPVCLLVEMGDSSVNFDLRFWITDPQEGQTNVRSAVLLAVWDMLHANGIDIPFPQRDVHIRSWTGPGPGPGPAGGLAAPAATGPADDRS